MNDFRKTIIPGKQLLLGNKSYLIESVYNYTDELLIYLGSFQNKKYLIKEYYPLSIAKQLERRDKTIIAQNAHLFIQKKQAFRNRMRELYATVAPLDVSNWLVDLNHPAIFDSKEYNTVYIIENFDQTQLYKNYHETDLLDLINNFLALVRLTSALHDHGYIIYNLEPQNILIRKYSGHTFLSLLDYSYLSPSHQNPQCISNYSAPEIADKQAGLSNETSDNYAIGLMLKERLKNISLECVHYRLKNLLMEIIDNTVCPIDRRFSDEKLLVGLLKCRDFASLRYPIATKVFNKHNFYGHLEEYRKLERTLAKENVAFISGPHGIGKRALAYQYAYNHNHDYANIIFVDFQISWINTFEHLRYNKPLPIDLSIEELLLELTIALDGSLLIVDNYLPQENDQWLNYLTKLNIKIILTSCEKIKSAVKVKPLNSHEAFELFNNCYAKQLNDNEIPRLEELLTYTDGNPGLIKLIAKTLKYRHRSFLGSNIIYYLNEIHKKDDIQDIFLMHGKIIFKLKKFDHQEMKLMKYLYFFKDIYFSTDNLIKLGFKQQLLTTLSYENILVKHGDYLDLNPIIEHYLADLESQKKLSLDEHLTLELVKLKQPNIDLVVLQHLKPENSLYQELCNPNNFIKGDLKLVEKITNYPFNEIYNSRCQKDMELNNFLIDNAERFQKIFAVLKEYRLKQLFNQALTSYENQNYQKTITLLNEINYYLIFEYYNDLEIVNNFYRIANVYYVLHDYKHALKYLEELFKLLSNNKKLVVQPEWVQLLDKIKAQL